MKVAFEPGTELLKHRPILALLPSIAVGDSQWVHVNPDDLRHLMADLHASQRLFIPIPDHPGSIRHQGLKLCPNDDIERGSAIAMLLPTNPTYREQVEATVSSK